MFNHPKNSISQNPLFCESGLFEEFKRMPLGFVDIGARGGAHDLVVPVAEIVSVVGFEPDGEECERLMAIPEIHQPWAEFRLMPVALASESSHQALYHTAAPTNYSLRPSHSGYVSRYNMKQFEVTGKSEVETMPLDEVCRSNFKEQQNFGEFIKLDTQGTEWEILQGSVDVLNENTVAVVCEVSFFEVYQGQKLFSEVELFLRNLGFSFYGFTSHIHTRSCKLLDKRCHVTRERAMYADAVFLRDPIVSKRVNSARQNKVLLLSSLLLGYYDFALELGREVVEWEGEKDAESFRKLVSSISQISPQESLRKIEEVVAQAKSDPSAANVVIGSYVDGRRDLCDYDDVMAVSQHIKNAR